MHGDYAPGTMRDMIPTRDMGVNCVVNTRSIGVMAPSVSSPQSESDWNKKKKRNWFVRILMLPYDALEWLLRRWCSPNESCMDCVKVTYWIVLIIAAILGAIVTIAPFLK
jgi:hypothetical protein